jgi:hypothetical protein
MAFLSTIETFHNYGSNYKLVNYIGYFNLTAYYFANYNHLILYIIDHCINFDYLVRYKLVIFFVLVPLALLFVLLLLV